MLWLIEGATHSEVQLAQHLSVLWRESIGIHVHLARTFFFFPRLPSVGCRLDTRSIAGQREREMIETRERKRAVVYFQEI